MPSRFNSDLSSCTYVMIVREINGQIASLKTLLYLISYIMTAILFIFIISLSSILVWDMKPPICNKTFPVTNHHILEILFVRIFYLLSVGITFGNVMIVDKEKSSFCSIL